MEPNIVAIGDTVERTCAYCQYPTGAIGVVLAILPPTDLSSEGVNVRYGGKIVVWATSSLKLVGRTLSRYNKKPRRLIRLSCCQKG